MDAVTVLKADHRSVERLFKEFEAAGGRAFAAQATIVSQIISAMSVHAEIEESVFYPAVARAVAQTKATVLESLEEHLGAKRLLADLGKMEPTDERFHAKVTVLIGEVRHHVRKEEHHLFPKVADRLSRERLEELGEQLLHAKAAASSRPLPRAPASRPRHTVVGPASGTTDGAKDAGEHLPLNVNFSPRARRRRLPSTRPLEP